MALGSTQPLTEMSTGNLPGGKWRPARKAYNLTAICEPTVHEMWEPRRLTTLWASPACFIMSQVVNLHHRSLRPQNMSLSAKWLHIFFPS
jgi:hypothetical protein